MRDPRQEPGFKGKRLDERAYQIQCAILEALGELIALAKESAKPAAPEPRPTRKADTK